MMDYWDEGYGNGWGLVAMGVMMLVLVAITVVVVLLIVRYVGAGERGGPSVPAPRRDDALETLRMRFATGEIDEAKFKERFELLKDTGAPEGNG